MLVSVTLASCVIADQLVGSGILSFMSVQAGAAQVIALEASSMAEKIKAVSCRSLVASRSC